MNGQTPVTPTTTKEIIRPLLHSPQLPLIARELEAILAAEQEKRHRFYDEITETQKAEFINGEIIVHSPVKLRHERASANLFILLSSYVRKHNLGYVGHEKLLVTFTRNDYEPDICFFGQVKAQTFSADQTKFPAPDLVVEVLSNSTQAIDRGVKFEDYALHDVGEHWLVDPNQESVEQYLLQENLYQLAVKVKQGTIQSSLVNGFEIPVGAIFDPAEHLAVLQRILS
jgi:Uma2 family endonuclease